REGEQRTRLLPGRLISDLPSIKHAGRLAWGGGGQAARRWRGAGNAAPSICLRLWPGTPGRSRALGHAPQLCFERNGIDTVGFHHRDHYGVGEHFPDGRFTVAPTCWFCPASTDCQRDHLG